MAAVEPADTGTFSQGALTLPSPLLPTLAERCLRMPTGLAPERSENRWAPIFRNVSHTAAFHTARILGLHIEGVSHQVPSQ